MKTRSGWTGRWTLALVSAMACVDGTEALEPGERAVDAACCPDADAGGPTDADADIRGDTGVETPLDTGLRPDSALPGDAATIPTTCRFEALEPVRLVDPGGTSRADAVRLSTGFAVVVIGRDASRQLHLFLHRWPDTGPTRPPEQLTASLVTDTDNVETVTSHVQDDALWIALRIRRWDGESTYENWVMVVDGAPPYETIQLDGAADYPRRIEPRADGTFDVFYGYNFVDRIPPRVIRYDRQGQIVAEATLRVDAGRPGSAFWQPPDLYLDVRQGDAGYQLWRARLGIGATNQLDTALGPVGRAAIHVGGLIQAGESLVMPTWESELQSDGRRVWRTYVRRLGPSGALEVLWRTEEQAERPRLTRAEACGWFLGAGTGALRDTNPVSTNGDLWWLQEDDSGRLATVQRFEDVLPVGENGCIGGLHLAGGPQSVLAVWLDGCRGWSVHARRLRLRVD